MSKAVAYNPDRYPALVICQGKVGDHVRKVAHEWNKLNPEQAEAERQAWIGAAAAAALADGCSYTVEEETTVLVFTKVK